MEPYSFKMFVPQDQWVAMPPQITKFKPGHDARIIVDPSAANATTIDISLEFNVAMDCNGLTQAISVNMSSSGKGGNPTIDPNSVNCGNVTNPAQPELPGMGPSVFFWNATVTGVPDGILVLTVNNPKSQDGTASTNVSELNFVLLW